MSPSLGGFMAELYTFDDEERPWVVLGSCRDADPDIFFSIQEADTTVALRICRGCPVLEECREWAILTRQPYGVWGGLTDRQRRRLYRRSA